MKQFEIFEEGFKVMEGSGKAHSIGFGYGETFEEACEEFHKRTSRGEKRKCKDGTFIYSDWGCKWFQTLEEAQKSFG